MIRIVFGTILLSDLCKLFYFWHLHNRALDLP